MGAQMKLKRIVSDRIAAAPDSMLPGSFVRPRGEESC